MIVLFGTCRERFSYWEHGDAIVSEMRDLAVNDIASGTIAKYATYIHEGREQIVDAFLSTEATHLMFVDSDNIIPTGATRRLLSHNKPIVSGLYFKRQGAPEAVAFEWAEESHTKFHSMSQSIAERMRELGLPASSSEQIVGEPSECLMEADVVGFGTVLIQREAIEEMKKANGIIFGKHGLDVGEDVVFCRLAQDLGMKIWVDIGVQSGHMAKYVITSNDFLGIKEWSKA